MAKPPKRSGKASPRMGKDQQSNGRGVNGASPDAAFDLWLRHGLHAMFDDIAREPIPEELLRLIESDRRGK
ncbi:MAG: hypothetical protein K2X11_05805 [Acetobacteraceae bacterium]|nr:hypothetical protein [Acetobacteraceae bacterium]